MSYPLIHVHLAAGEAEAALATERHPFLFQAVRAQICGITRLQGATAEHFVDDGLHVAILVAWMALLEGSPVIAEDLLEGVFVDPLPCGCHRARLYHVLAAEASRFFTLLSLSLPIAAPGGAGRRGDLEKGNSYTLKVTSKQAPRNLLIDFQRVYPVIAYMVSALRHNICCVDAIKRVSITVSDSALIVFYLAFG